MQTFGKGVVRLAIAAAALMVGGSGLAWAQRAALPCSAFVRNAGGGWTVEAPIMLDLGGRLYAPTVGTTFTAGAMQNGVEMSDVLDRECGNR
jgi:hypothetical protein